MFINTCSDYTIIGACVLRDNNIAAILRKNIESKDLDFYILYFDGSVFHELPLGSDYFIGIVNQGDDVFALGMNGNIIRYTLFSSTHIDDILSSRKDWFIEESADYGALIRIRVLGNDILCCGQFSQLYIYESDSWRPFDHGLRTYDSADLQDIGGNSRNDIYVVGLDGLVNKFNGQKWVKIDVPTNQHILCIGRCENGELFMGGYNGLVLTGKDDIWQLKGEPYYDKRYWDCTKYGEFLYFAHSKGIDYLFANTIHRADIKTTGETLTFHRLFAGEKYLWSFGEQHILFFDNDEWREFTMTSATP